MGSFTMTQKKRGLENRSHWTLSHADKINLAQYRKDYRLFMAIQLCSMRVYGRCLFNGSELPFSILYYLADQLDRLPTVTLPEKKTTHKLKDEAIEAIILY
jgi:hypothetical protein